MESALGWDVSGSVLNHDIAIGAVMLIFVGTGLYASLGVSSFFLFSDSRERHRSHTDVRVVGDRQRAGLLPRRARSKRH